jgi:hypothetical protein
MEASHKDPTALPVMDPKNWTKNFEAIDEYFRGTRGHKKHPVKYVYRDLLVPPLAAVDPQTGVVGSNHFSHDDELIVRGPILLAGAAVGPDAETLGPFASSFLVDRAEVWEKLAEILLPHDAFTVIKAAKKTQNGRLAYQLLFRHYLGPNNVGNMAGEAEQVPRLHILAGILRIPVFSVPVALFPQESRFLFRRNLFFTPSEILSVWGQRRMLRRK